MTKAKCERSVEAINDPITHEVINTTKSVPVLINYTVEKKRFNKKPDEWDLRNIYIENIDYNNLPNANIKFSKGDKTNEMLRGNLKYIWQVYRKRTLLAIQLFVSNKIEGKSLFLLTSALPKLTILNRFMPEHGSRALVGPMAGTFYLPALSVENNVIHQLEFQFKKLKNLTYNSKETIISTQSASNLKQLPNNTIDYIFIDPPFGANIMYSELNILSESWLKILTNNKKEAIINNTQAKDINSYSELMTYSFEELYRVLKPNRWITIEFHNSRNAVWNVIQESINKAGFVIADIRVLNKEKKTINQFNAKGTVDQDLVISAYKPKASMVREFTQKAGTEDTVWAFVREHLSNVSVTVKNNGKLEIISERQAFLLWDRMVAYHIMQGIPVFMY